MNILLLLVLFILLCGVAPAWPYSAGWGYGPSGAVGFILILLIVLLLLRVL